MPTSVILFEGVVPGIWDKHSEEEGALFLPVNAGDCPVSTIAFSAFVIDRIRGHRPQEVSVSLGQVKIVRQARQAAVGGRLAVIVLVSITVGLVGSRSAAEKFRHVWKEGTQEINWDAQPFMKREISNLFWFFRYFIVTVTSYAKTKFSIGPGVKLLIFSLVFSLSGLTFRDRESRNADRP